MVSFFEDFAGTVSFAPTFAGKIPTWVFRGTFGLKYPLDTVNDTKKKIKKTMFSIMHVICLKYPLILVFAGKIGNELLKIPISKMKRIS